MKTTDDVLDALRKGDTKQAFDTCMNIIGFHQFLSRCHLSILEPHVPHKIYIYDELIACKTREGGRVYLSINLDWIRQELTVNIQYGFLKFVTPSKYRWYRDISDAIPPRRRLIHFLVIEHRRKIVVIEPILDFILNEFVEQIKQLHPEAVYVGYDNHNCKLPEPKLEKTKQLIKDLETFTEVRVKTLRKAWYEN